MSNSFKQFLQEAPIGDYKTFGNFDKNSSFRSARDRFLIKNPRTIDIVKKKFNSTNHNFNLYFVNSPKANKHTEVGEVDPKWVSDNLGEDIYNEVVNGKDFDESVNIIFTNNKGSERMAMTGWIMAHRIGHALARRNGMKSGYEYVEASNALLDAFANCMEYYSINDVDRTDDRFSRTYTLGSYNKSKRRNQLLMLSFFYEVATFKSARDKNIRDWFEVLNELIAQYITTGKIKFNKTPRIIELKGPNGFRYYCKDVDAVNEILETLENTMEYYISEMLYNAQGNIYVM